MKQFAVNLALQSDVEVNKLMTTEGVTISQIGANIVIEADDIAKAVQKLSGIGEIKSINQRPTVADQVRAQGVQLPKVLTNMRTGKPVEAEVK